MGISGPAPNPNRRRRNADTYADVQTRIVAGRSRLNGPTWREASASVIDLRHYDEGVAELVERWWTRWRRSPLAEAFLETDWERLMMVAPLVANYYAHPHFAKLAEIRQNESLLGATVVDRLKARIKVEPADEKPAEAPPGVAALDDYRARLTG